MREAKINATNIVDEYLSEGDAAKENANMALSPNGLLFAVGGAGMAKDYLNRIEDAGFGELSELHRKGGVHIHDTGLGFVSPYCAGFSLAGLLDNGIKAGAVHSGPAKHMRTAINHMINFIGSCSNEFAGAIAFSDMDIYLTPYAFKAYLDYKKRGCNDSVAFSLAKREVYQSVQEFIFHLNYNNRFGGQTAFSNITLAMTCPGDMKDRLALVAGKRLADFYEHSECGFTVSKDLTYGDLADWQLLIVNAILDTFLSGDINGNGFTFPILTLNVTPAFFDHPCKEKVFELTAKFGTPYFQNFCNGQSGGEKIEPSDVRSMCCRLSISNKDVHKHTGGLFGNAEQTGSLQVITLSLPYLAAKARLESGALSCVPVFCETLKHWMGLCRDEMLWKREIVSVFLRRGFFPMAASNLSRGFETFFTTIGFVGLWEAVEILTGNEDSFLTEEGMKLAQEILTTMRETTRGFIEETGKLFNMEATPAESACYKLAQKALKEFPGIPHGGLKKAPYFTNSCHIPVELQDKLDLVFMTQSKLQVIPNGGTVTHFYTGEDLTADQIETFVKMVCKSPIPYFSVTAIYSICPICGRVAGAWTECPNNHTPQQIENLKQTRPDLVTGGGK